MANIKSSSTARLSSIAILITNENISKLGIRYTNIKDWIFVFSLLSEKFLKKMMIDGKKDEREAWELKKVFNHYLEKKEVK